MTTSESRPDRSSNAVYERFPVVTDGRVVGCVSRTDVLRAMHRRTRSSGATSWPCSPTRCGSRSRMLVEVNVEDGVVTLRGTSLPDRPSRAPAMMWRFPGECRRANRVVATEPNPSQRRRPSFADRLRITSAASAEILGYASPGTMAARAGTTTTDRRHGGSRPGSTEPSARPSETRRCRHEPDGDQQSAAARMTPGRRRRRRSRCRRRRRGRRRPTRRGASSTASTWRSLPALPTSAPSAGEIDRAEQSRSPGVDDRRAGPGGLAPGRQPRPAPTRNRA